MQTRAEQYQAIIRRYREVTGNEAVDMHEVAKFAIGLGVKPPRPKTPEALLAEKFSAAAREETAKDEVTGRPYRVNVAITDWRSGEQLTFWHTLDAAPRPVAHKGLMQRREQMVGDAVSLADDADHWNRVHPDQEPIQIPLDFEFDVMLRRHAPPDDEEKAA
jgi:hypothetical protein